MTQAWDEQLRARGYRVTPQRQLVLEAVARLGHATPEDICAEIRQAARGVNVSTVYRTLELLEQIGMVTHTHLGHGAPAITSPPRLSTCTWSAGTARRSSRSPGRGSRPLVTALDAQFGFETDVGHLTVFGRCEDCRPPTDR